MAARLKLEHRLCTHYLPDLFGVFLGSATVKKARGVFDPRLAFF
jgi:hypothetical protein